MVFEEQLPVWVKDWRNIHSVSACREVRKIIELGSANQYWLCRRLNYGGLTSTTNLALPRHNDGVADVVGLVVANVSVSFTVVEAVIDATGDTDRRDLIDVRIVVGTNLPLELFAVVARIEIEVAVDEMTGVETTAEMDALAAVESDSTLEILEVTVPREMLDACCGRPGAVRGGVNGKRIDSEALVDDT